MIDEMSALQSNGTWDLVSQPFGKIVVDFRWVFIVKIDHDGLLIV